MFVGILSEYLLAGKRSKAARFAELGIGKKFPEIIVVMRGIFSGPLLLRYQAFPLGVAYLVLGGVIFALGASFRLLSDKVDSFFALLIPEPVSRSLCVRGRRGSGFALERVTAVAEERKFSEYPYRLRT